MENGRVPWENGYLRACKSKLQPQVGLLWDNYLNHIMLQFQ